VLDERSSDAAPDCARGGRQALSAFRRINEMWQILESIENSGFATSVRETPSALGYFGRLIPEAL
jgi:hypothetical protein